MADDNATVLAAIRRSRAVLDSLGDARAVMLCDLALLRAARARGHDATLAAALAPLRRMVAASGTHGAEIVAAELLLGTAGATPPALVEALAELLRSGGRPELIAAVTDRVLVEGAALPPDQGRALLRSAVDLAVRCAAPLPAAAILEALAAHHEGAGEHAIARLCYVQAARYAQRATPRRPARANELYRDAVALRYDRGAERGETADVDWLSDAVSCAMRVGDFATAVEAAWSLGVARLDQGRWDDAARVMRDVAPHASALDDPDAERRFHEAFERALAATGATTAAEGARNRARLYALADED